MWMSERDRRLLTVSVTASFRSFGMGQGGTGNPIAEALKDQPPQFAAGVDIREVIDHVVSNIEVISEGYGEASAHGESQGKGKASSELTNRILENIGAATSG